MDRCKMKLIKLSLYLAWFLLFFSLLPSFTIKKIKPQRYLVIVVILLENLAFVKLCNRDRQYRSADLMATGPLMPTDDSDPLFTCSDVISWSFKPLIESQVMLGGAGRSHWVPGAVWAMTGALLHFHAGCFWRTPICGLHYYILHIIIYLGKLAGRHKQHLGWMLNTCLDYVIMLVCLNLAPDVNATVSCVIWTKPSDGPKAEHRHSWVQMVFKSKSVIQNLPGILL